jgi:hypothetical protein
LLTTTELVNWYCSHDGGASGASHIVPILESNANHGVEGFGWSDPEHTPIGVVSEVITGMMFASAFPVGQSKQTCCVDVKAQLNSACALSVAMANA